MKVVKKEEIEKLVKELMEPKYDWCKPVGNGLFKTGDCYHGKDMVKDLNKALREYHNNMEWMVSGRNQRIVNPSLILWEFESLSFHTKEGMSDRH